MSKKIYFFIGTTAEFIKIVPIISELKKKEIPFKIITSGQTKVLFDEFTKYIGLIRADIAFKEKGNKSSVPVFIFWAVKTFFYSLYQLKGEFEKLDKKNCFFIVHGDTVSSLIGSLVAKIYNLKIVHVESGLRSFNFFEPFPEELSRYVISWLSEVHFCPNSWSINNIKSVQGKKINTFQNTLFDSYHMTKKYNNVQKKERLIKGKYFVLVMHRQEHVVFDREKSKRIIELILKESSKKLKCVFIVHDLSKTFIESIEYSLRENSHYSKVGIS